MSNRLIQLLAVSAALALTGVAGATTRAQAPGVTVKYGDLALNTKAGIVSLHSRIRSAAEQVCSPLNSRVLGLREQYESCVTEATSQGVAAVGNGNLSNFHRFGTNASIVASN